MIDKLWNLFSGKKEEIIETKENYRIKVPINPLNHDFKRFQINYIKFQFDLLYRSDDFFYYDKELTKTEFKQIENINGIFLELYNNKYEHRQRAV